MALMTVEELEGRLADPRLVICDVRWYLADPGQGRIEYRESHLPGARFVDLDTDLSATAGPGRHPLPTTAAFARTLGRMGIGPDHTVVAYDSSGGAIAARMWWMLDAVGHRSVFVLDGGLPAWERAGLPLTAETPSVTAVEYPPPPPGWTGVVDGDRVNSLLGRGLLLDARSEDRYRGENETIDPRAGHIPTAVSAFFGQNLTDGGSFLTAGALRRRFAELGVNESAPTVAYCGSGVTACHNLLAMRVAGLPGLLYEGSWSDWSGRADRPIATGARPGEAPSGRPGFG